MGLDIRCIARWIPFLALELHTVSVFCLPTNILERLFLASNHVSMWACAPWLFLVTNVKERLIKLQHCQMEGEGNAYPCFRFLHSKEIFWAGRMSGYDHPSCRCELTCVLSMVGHNSLEVFVSKLMNYALWLLPWGPKRFNQSWLDGLDEVEPKDMELFVVLISILILLMWLSKIKRRERNMLAATLISFVVFCLREGVLAFATM